MKEKILKILRHHFLQWGFLSGVGLMTAGMIIANLVSLQKSKKTLQEVEA